MWGCVVKAPSAWLTYIGSLPLTSYQGSSLTNTGLHIHTHTLYPSLRRLCSLMPRLHSLSPSFPLPSPPFCPLWHLCVVRYEQYLLKKNPNCAAMSGLTKREISKHTLFLLFSQVNLITQVYHWKEGVMHSHLKQLQDDRIG